MRLSNKQKQALHSAARAAGVNDVSRRTIQWNVGGFYSAADATCSREGFIAVMAFYETQYLQGCVPGFTAGYWARQDREANPTDAVLHRIEQLRAALGLPKDKLDEFIHGPHFTRGLYRGIDELPAVWLRKLLEALKAIARRKGAAA